MTSLTVSAKLDSVSLSSFDSDQTKATALLNNVIVFVNEAPVVIDSSKGTVENGEVHYTDGDLSITITNVLEDGVVTITATYQELVATATFNMVMVGPRASVKSAPIQAMEAPASTGSEKGNVVDAPASVSAVRDINSESAQTPAAVDSTETVSNVSAVVNPQDVATPVNNPETVAASIPEPEVAFVAYNKVSIVYENGETSSLFQDGEGSKLVVVFQNGTYINALSGNKVEFSANDASGTVSFDMREMDASGNVIATSNGTYSK